MHQFCVTDQVLILHSYMINADIATYLLHLSFHTITNLP